MSDEPAHDKSEPELQTELDSNPTTVTPTELQEENTASIEQSLPASSTGVVTSKKRRFSLKPENLLPGPIRNKLGKFARPVSIAILILLLVVIGAVVWFVFFKPSDSIGTQNFSLEVAPFGIVNTIPGNEQINVNTASTITLNFNRPVSADKIEGNIMIDPMIEGTYTQGDSDNVILFTPLVPLSQGTIVRVVVHGSLKSDQGEELGPDHAFNFSTSLPANGVIFQQADTYSTLTNAKSNENQTFKLLVGEEVDPNGEVTLYEATTDSLLSSMIYKDVTTDSGYIYEDYANASIDLTGLKSLQVFKGLRNDQVIDINKDKGVYLLVATSNGKQAGKTWVIFSNHEMLVKQDDKRTVIAALDSETKDTTGAQATLYNLKNDVTVIDEISINGLEEVETSLDNKLDFVVAEIDDEVVVVPVAALYSMADIRAFKDLDTTKRIYGLTDRPTYKSTDTIKFGGYIRTDNDAQYQLPTETKLSVYAGEYVGDASAVEVTASVKSGAFSGELAASSLVSADKPKRSLVLFAYEDLAAKNAVQIASFEVQSSSVPEYTFDVTFDKKDYLANEKVAAKVVAKTVSGQPLASTDITYNIFAKDYYEGNDRANLDSFGATGMQVGSENSTLKLDANGQATISIDKSKLPAGASHVVTVQVNKNDAAGNVAAGGASATIHQGDAVLNFGSGKSIFAPDNVASFHIYAKTLSGSALTNTPVAYRVLRIGHSTDGTVKEDVLADGSTTTNGDGYAKITEDLSKIKDLDLGAVTLEVTTKDAINNTVVANKYVYIENSDTGYVYSEDQQKGLDITGTDTYVDVGENVQLTINSPVDRTVLVSYARGRIYKYEVLKLQKGDNNLSFDVTSELFPSFSLSLSYTDNGKPYNDGVYFTVASNDKKATVTATTDKQTYKAGDTAQVQIATMHDGSGVQSQAIVGIVEESIFRLNRAVVPDIFTSLYGARSTSINSSSSFTDMGSGGGGRCGGDHYGQSGLSNSTGEMLYWNASATTDASGNVTLPVKLKSGTWRVYVYTLSKNGLAGSTITNFTVQ